MYVQMNNLTTLRTGRQFRLTVHRRGPLILSYESFFSKYGPFANHWSYLPLFKFIKFIFFKR